MYQFFEQGVCDALRIKPSQITKEAKELLKQAFTDPYTTLTPQGMAMDNAQMPQEHGNASVPWKGIGLGLLGAGAAYGLGKFNPSGMLGGFSKGVDNTIVNPIRNVFMPSVDSEMSTMQNHLGNNMTNNIFNGINKPSQLQGTPFYEPGKLQSAADTVGNTAANVDLSSLGIRGIMAGARKFTPQFAERAGSSMLGGIGRAAEAVSTPLKVMGRDIPVLNELMTVPDSLQLGDKLNDKLNIQNKWGRGAVQAGTVAGGIGTALTGAEIGSFAGPIGTVAGGLVGGLAPTMLNSLINRFNNNRVMQNMTNSNLNTVNTDFQRAMAEKARGNMNPMNAWYRLQGSPDMLNRTIDLNKGNSTLQDEMRSNNPNAGL